MKRRRLVALALGMVLAAGAPAAAVGSTGVSIDVGSIAVADQLAAGGEYRLPTFGVRNPGTEPTSYAIAISYMDEQSPMRPPADWFDFSPATLTLAGGEARPVLTTLDVPPDAEPGEYLALIGPEIVNEGGGAQVGAGAAVRLTFAVATSTGLDAWLRWLWRLLGAHPWIWAVPLLAGLYIGARYVRRRFTFNVARRA